MTRSFKSARTAADLLFPGFHHHPATTQLGSSPFACTKFTQTFTGCWLCKQLRWLYPLYLASCPSRWAYAASSSNGMVYLLYPLVFNVNLFEFHPDVPLSSRGVLAARRVEQDGFV